MNAGDDVTVGTVSSRSLVTAKPLIRPALTPGRFWRGGTAAAAL